MGTWNELTTAVDQMLDIIEGMDSGLEHLTCTEIESIARVADLHRGEESATRIIMLHVVGAWGDSDEEYDELAAHIEAWPQLPELIRTKVSETCTIQSLLTEVLEGDNDNA